MEKEVIVEFWKSVTDVDPDIGIVEGFFDIVGQGKIPHTLLLAHEVDDTFL